MDNVKGPEWSMSILIMMLFILIYPLSGEGLADDGIYHDPVVTLLDEKMADQIDENGTIGGSFDIYWFADDLQDGSDIWIELNYRNDDLVWRAIAKDQPNDGHYRWNTTGSDVPDGNGYSLKAVAYDQDCNHQEAYSELLFCVENPDSPTLSSISIHEGMTVSGVLNITWTCFDPDPQDSLTCEISICSDLLEEFSALCVQDGYRDHYLLDTVDLDNAEGYRMRLVVTDGTGLSAELISGNFTITNEQDIGCSLRSPLGGEVVERSVPIIWDCEVQGEIGEKLRVNIHSLQEGRSQWEIVMEALPLSGSYQWNVLDLDDGEYRLRVDVCDEEDTVMNRTYLDLIIFNPDPPELTPVFWESETVTFTAYYGVKAVDPDAGETALLQVSYLISADGVNWELLSSNLNATGTFIFDCSEYLEGRYLVKARVIDPTVTYLVTEFVFEPLIIERPDSPTVEFIAPPADDTPVSGDLRLDWMGNDRDGDDLTYSLFIRRAGEGWIEIEGDLLPWYTNYTIDTSLLSPGNYEVMVVAEDSSPHHLSQTDTTGAFFVVNGVVAQEGSEPSSLGGTLLITAALISALIGVMISYILIRRDRRMGSMDRPPLNEQPPEMPVQDNMSEGGDVEKERRDEEVRKMYDDIIGLFGRRGENGSESEDGTRVDDLELIFCGFDDNDLQSYRVLGLEMNARPEEIEGAYRRLIKRFHPDKVSDDTPTLKRRSMVLAARLNRAKEILTKPESRAMLDSKIREMESEFFRKY